MAFDPDALVAAARQSTGLEDLGGDSWREGLEVLCRSLSNEAQLNGFGQMALPGAIIGALSNRLKVTNWIKTHPDVLNEKIENPFVVVGIFRAGTTLFSYLLEKDERHRPLYRWEASDSTPPPTPEGIAADPRIDATRAQMAIVDQFNPRMKVVQSEEPDGPTECISVTGQDFKSTVWEAMANIPEYGRWLAAADQTATYDYYKRVLQLLQSGGVRKRWTLKAPSHALQLEQLVRVLPGARLVLLHRDPVSVVTSACSLITTLTGTFSDAARKTYIAEQWVETLARSYEAIERFRAARPDVLIADVRYADLMRDPIATMRRVYGQFGDTIEGQPEAAMRKHLESRPQGKHGKHDYGASEFGLNAGAILERFKPYIQRYDIELEGKA